ncbi:MAG: choice-of-anchor D domain-containing protein, partial [Chthoniobacteraceae bacterium]
SYVYVYSLAVSGSNLYAGGSFTTAGGVSAANIAKWNGSAWSALGTGMNSYILALTLSGSDLYAGGAFNTAGGTAASGVAKWNGSAWSALGLGANSTVYALAVSGGDLFAGGLFTTAGGVPANRVAKWNGSTWSALGSGMDNSVSALAADASGRVFVGGSFALAGTTVSPFIAQANLLGGVEIAAEQPAGTNLTDGTSTVAFGATLPGGAVVKTFTVRSTGNLTLTLSGITKDGANAADFTVGALSSSTLAAGGSATFDVTFNPSAPGARSAAIHIGNNDADENPFDLSLSGTGTAAEIGVEQPVGADLTDGSATVVYGGTLPGTPVVKTFTIKNTGDGLMSLSGVSLDGTNAGDFSIGALSSSTVAVGGSATFSVTFNPATPGARTAAIHIGNTDANENPFDINLTGTGTAPEIAIEQPVSFDLTDGSTTVAYGGITYGTSLAKTFTIKNAGDGTLLLYGVTKDGTNAAEFSIGALSSSTVAPGGSATFTVTFNPATAGAKTAGIHVSNS